MIDVAVNTLSDRFQGDEYALGPSGSLPWDPPSEGLYLLIQPRAGCIFQLKVPPLHAVKLLKKDREIMLFIGRKLKGRSIMISNKKDIGKAIPESPEVFELYFREKALNDPELLKGYGISSGNLLLISLQSPTLPDKAFDTTQMIERHHHHHSASRHDSLLPSTPPPPTPTGSGAQSAKPLLPLGRSGSLWSTQGNPCQRSRGSPTRTRSRVRGYRGGRGGKKGMATGKKS